MISKILGEEAGSERFPVSDIGVPEPTDAETGEEENDGDPFINPNVEALVAQWRGGNKQSVALRVLDTLDSYADFVSLLYEVGESDARELGQIMDELTRNERSPRSDDSAQIPVEGGEPDEPSDVPLRHIGRHESQDEPEGFDDFVNFLAESGLPLKKRLRYDRLLTKLAARRK